MRDALAGPAAKVKRAGLHLEVLHDEIRAFQQSEPAPHGFVSKVDVDSSRYLLRVRIFRPPPVELSLIAGDFIQNLRAALDHLIWRLVQVNGQRPTRGNLFPIFDQEPPTKSSHAERRRWNASLRGVHPGAIRFIESCQPYKGSNGPSRHLLAGLRKLSNEDKHRTLIQSFAAIQGRPDLMNIEVIGVRDVRSPVEGGKVHTGRALKDYDLVLEAPVEIVGSNPQVKLNGEFPLDIGFGWKPIPLQGFRQMIQAVAGMIAHSRRFIGE